MSTSLARACVPVVEDPADPFERARPVREHPGRVGQGGEQLAQRSAGTGVARRGGRPRLRTACSNRAEPEPAGAVRSPPSRAMTTVIAATQVVDLNGCFAAVQRGWPHALEQVADLLDARDVLIEQLLAAGTEVPQPAPGLIDRFGQVAAQLRGQPGDQDRVLVVGLVAGQVLGPAGPRRQPPVARTRTTCPASAASWPSTRHR